MNKEKKEKRKLTKTEKLRIFRLVIFAVVMIVIIIFSFKLFDVINKLSNDAYKLEFKQKVSDMGFLGILFVLGLQIVQIVIAVIPGQPVEVITGMLYGTYYGVLICTIGIFLGTAIVYYAVKKIGKDIAELFFKPKDIEKTMKMKVFQDSTKLELFLFFIFLIPAIPKDLFIYLGAVTNIKPKRFLLLATIPRIPGLFLTVYAGSKITEGSYFIVGVVTLIVVAFWIIGFYINSKMQKEEIKTNETTKT